jgi:hypothetical protein
VPWTLIASTVGGAVVTLVGVFAGGWLAHRSQGRQWFKDTQASAYRNVLREYARTEFDVRRAYLGQLDVTAVDWPRWGAAVTELSLVADEAVLAPAAALSSILVDMERFVHGGTRDDEQWRALQHSLAEAQLRFVNAARRSLSGAQAPLPGRVGGPLITQ